MTDPILANEVETYFQANADGFGLRASAVTALPVLNWGGSGNRSITISDGRTSLHLKLAGNDRYKRGLRAWWRLRVNLERDYRAPKSISWVVIPAAGREGVLFDHIDGQVPDPTDITDLLPEVIETVQQLHIDSELAAQIGQRGPSHRDYFSDLLMRRFRVDLELLTEDRPGFVSDDLFRWLAHETDVLQSMVEISPAFSGQAFRPTHGDLWFDNMMIDENGRWFILDWDTIPLGDPPSTTP